MFPYKTPAIAAPRLYIASARYRSRNEPQFNEIGRYVALMTQPWVNPLFVKIIALNCRRLSPFLHDPPNHPYRLERPYHAHRQRDPCGIGDDLLAAARAEREQLEAIGVAADQAAK
jgi:hypothetical protein